MWKEEGEMRLTSRREGFEKGTNGWLALAQFGNKECTDPDPDPDPGPQPVNPDPGLPQILDKGLSVVPHCIY